MRLVVLMLFYASLATGTLAAPASGRADPDLVPGTVVARGGFVSEAWLIAPTQRYDHFVRNNSAEAGGLRLRLKSGAVLTLMLAENRVFEDGTVRLADLDGDGREEVVLVLTSLDEGAALAVYGIVDDAIALRAQTPFIGQPNRWLNPAGIADFDGDGRPEIALVQMPHLVKRLELWRLEGSRLRRITQVQDVTNHRIGSPHTGMAAVGDFNGDGVADLAIPDGSRTVLRFLSFAGGRTTELRSVPLPGPADGDLGVASANGKWRVTVPLQSGKSVSIAQ